ncbi:MAG: aminotransferase class IV [Gaiellaceae bacterium]
MTILAVAVGGRGLVDPESPVLHADDEALLRGRAAFETIRVYAGRPFRLDAHVERLAESAARLALPVLDEAVVRHLAAEAIRGGGGGDGVLRLFHTPGREGQARPTSLAVLATLPPGLEELRDRGLRIVSLPTGLDPGIRGRAPWLLGGVKSTSYAPNMAAAAEAKRRDVDDAVLLGAGEVVLEAPTANVWWRRGSTLFTPGLETGILAGITRAVLLEGCRGLGYAVSEGIFVRAELAGSDEAFTSSSVREVMPIAELDGRALPRGPGAVELQAALRAAATR